ncbi:MAG: putative Peptidyl-prolyl cis-trans isomerase 4 [Streblomastix strix]|uniref:RING-type E3 ubiquitin-protein ligase PPIL2 n=1 Tax=Streblomastix strix TaxID=222440 RepID=A0A5J4WGJ8_9EUKA|nr:MAG: putative Peptidyl-prolyl cis-trans isomerase 4 [Streblomastix strix]
MGKSKNAKQYIKASEWKNEFGGKKDGDESKLEAYQPFDCCSLSLQPFITPVASPDGHVFDLENILGWIKDKKNNPISGKPLSRTDLIPLHYTKNAIGEFICPVTYKVFNKFTHIVAIKTSGEVYCFEAIKQLLNQRNKQMKEINKDKINEKKKEKRKSTKDDKEDDEEEEDDSDEEDEVLMHCPLTGKPFTVRDIITLQESNEEDLSKPADHQSMWKQLNKDQQDKNGQTAFERIEPIPHIVGNTTTTRILKILNEDNKLLKEKQAIEQREKEMNEQELKKKEDEIIYVNKDKIAFTSQIGHSQRAAATTSTEFEYNNENTLKRQEQEGKRIIQIKEKGYIALQTTFGTLNIELHCDLVPKTCDNFLQLCRNEYYSGTIFHRLIRGFMIQGGDPTATGTGGTSVWGGKFADEFYPSLSHNGRGILSMANSGPNTNGSQFFITFKACKHLDRVHSIFGRVVGGMPVLNAMEEIDTDDKDRPVEPIEIIGMTIFSDPFENLRQQMKRKGKEDEDEDDFDHKKNLLIKDKEKNKEEQIDNLLTVKKKRRRNEDDEEGEQKQIKKTKLDSSISSINTSKTSSFNQQQQQSQIQRPFSFSLPSAHGSDSGLASLLSSSVPISSQQQQSSSSQQQTTSSSGATRKVGKYFQDQHHSSHKKKT